MNSHFNNPPDSPEDRLLDALLHEQSHGPDEAFLARIEAAVDAGPQAVTQAPAARSYGGLAIAAGILLAAGLGIWWRPFAAPPRAPVSSNSEIPAPAPVVPERKEIVSGGMKKDLAARTRVEVPTVPPAKTDLAPSSADYFEAMPLAMNKDGLSPMDGMSLGTGFGYAKKGFGYGSSNGLGGGGISDSARRDKPQSSADGLDREAYTANQGGGSGKLFGLVPSAGHSGDRYGTFIDQPWKSSDRYPLSTFSIDVDTASYGNVRRMIREGRGIPQDAVRIEECVNAFNYHYAPPLGDGPFAVGATLAHCPWAPGHELVRVAIKGREIAAGQRPASNLVFLIDVSGSMKSPDKLPLLKRSMALLVGQLDERDHVAIVVYAGSEGVALPSTRLDAQGRATVLKTLSKLEAGGTTNGGAGIKRAYALATKQKIEGGVNRVILATDGDFNVGVTGRDSLVGLVKERARNGIYLTVLGFGTGNLNDSMMDAITRDGNGNYCYIDSDREGRKVFLQNLTGTLVTIAKDVKIQIEFNPAKVAGYRLIGYANRVLRNEDFNNDGVDAGDIGAGHTVTAFYELTPPDTAAATDNLKYQIAPPQPATSNEWLTVKLRYKHPDGDASRKIDFALTGEALALDKTDADYQFATAVALFGMKLRAMEDVRETAWDKVLTLAQPGLADDPTEDRAEFVELVKKLAAQNPHILPAPAEVRPAAPAGHEELDR